LPVFSQILKLDSIVKRHWNIVACSAVSGQGLVEGVDWIVSDIASRIYMLD
jgi:ADP-ribosylation factor-like protein 2